MKSLAYELSIVLPIANANIKKYTVIFLKRNLLITPRKSKVDDKRLERYNEF